MRWPNSYRYLTRLNVPTTEAERSRVETVLGALRSVLAVLALVAFSMETPEPAKFTHLVYILLVIWVAHSLAIFAYVSNRPVTPLFLRVLHAGDIIWPTLITAFSHGSSSPFVPMYSFAMISAGFRWGFPEALLTSLAGGIVLEIEALFLRGTAWGEFESNRVLMRSAYSFHRSGLSLADAAAGRGRHAPVLQGNRQRRSPGLSAAGLLSHVFLQPEFAHADRNTHA